MIENIKHPYGNKKISIIKFIRILIKKSIKFFLSLFFKFEKSDEIIISSAVHAPWLSDKKFKDIFSKVKNLTLLDEPRAYTLWQAVNNLKNVNGNILDIGCLLGGAGFIMSKSNLKGNTYLFDTFAGFKKDDGLHKKEVFKFEDILFVRKKIKSLKLRKTKVFKSYFPNNLPIKINKIKVCHIDVNTYIDTKKIFYFVEKKIVKNGIIIFDDYGIWGVDGIKKFISSIEQKYSKKFIFLKNYMGQCILIKK
jgi:O-methyltransferase